MWPATGGPKMSSTPRRIDGHHVIWILLAALGIPLWMVLGALGASLLSRRSFKRRPGVFPAKLRVVTDDATTPTTWPRRLAYAQWVHDVLLVQKGLALLRTEALPVAATGSSTKLTDEIRGLGNAPIVTTIVLDDGSSVDLATSSERHQENVVPE
jgi:hypothetical protein